jgi:hypothetical protein
MALAVASHCNPTIGSDSILPDRVIYAPPLPSIDDIEFKWYARYQLISGSSTTIRRTALPFKQGVVVAVVVVVLVVTAADRPGCYGC